MLIYVGGFYLCLPLLVAASLRWGGKPERLVAIMYTAAAFGTVITRHTWAVRYTQVETGVLALDVLLIMGLLWIATSTRLWWVILSAAFQIVAALAHFCKIVDQSFLTNGYSLMLGMSSWPALILLAIGIAHRRRCHKLNASNICCRS